MSDLLNDEDKKQIRSLLSRSIWLDSWPDEEVAAYREGGREAASHVRYTQVLKIVQDASDRRTELLKATLDREKTDYVKTEDAELPNDLRLSYIEGLSRALRIIEGS